MVLLPFTRAEAQCTPTLVSQQARFTKVSQGSLDFVGRNVAINGDWAVVGAHTDNNSHGVHAGTILVYQRTANGWTLHSELTSSNASTSDGFGISVAIDGDVIVAGAYLDDPPGASDGGYAYVFELQGGVWTETAALTAAVPAASDHFGWDVDVSGNSVIVGANLLDRSGAVDEGAAFVFISSAQGWTLQGQIDPSLLQTGLHCGSSVAIDGDTAVLGAPGTNVGPNGGQGSVFVFQRGGTTWNQIGNLTSPGGPGDAFGDKVAMGGARIVIGAPLANGPAGNDQGEVTVFSQQFGPWAFEQQLQAASAAVGDEFGTGIAVDGDTILVGARNANPVGGDSGAAYVFNLCGAGLNPWVEQARILPLDSHAGDWFGFQVGLSGSTAICGAHGFNGLGTDVGAAYLFELSRGAFTTYGFGDGSGTPCPCANESVPGTGQGCLNSSGLGAVLSAWGSDVATAADLALVGGNLVPSATALLFAGTTDLNGGAGIPFGDGLRVVDGSIKRLGVRVPDLDGNATWGPFSPAQGNWSAGQPRFFQIWYRDPFGPCSGGFNVSNGLQVDFQ